MDKFNSNKLNNYTKIRKEDFVGGMESLMELYKIGRGPSSSHTIGRKRRV